MTVSADADRLDSEGPVKAVAAEAYRESVTELRNGDGHPSGHGPDSSYLRSLVILALFDFRERYGIHDLVADLHADDGSQTGERREVPRGIDPLADAFHDLPPGGAGAQPAG